MKYSPAARRLRPENSLARATRLKRNPQQGTAAGVSRLRDYPTTDLVKNPTPQPGEICLRSPRPPRHTHDVFRQ